MQTHEAEASGSQATPMASQPITPAEAKQVQETCEGADGRSNAELAEATLRATMACARAVVDGIRHIASAIPNDDAARTDAPPVLLLGEPDGIAKLMMAASATTIATIEGMRQLPAMRAEAAAAVPGTQTVYPPGHGPYAESSHADGTHGKQDYPSRSTIESIDRALKEFREGKP